MLVRASGLALGLLVGAAALSSTTKDSAFQGIRSATPDFSGDVTKCQGYSVDSVSASHTGGLVAQLSLLAECNAFGTDIPQLTLSVEYESASRLHVHLYDAAQQQFQIPNSLIERPGSSTSAKHPKKESELAFDYTASPFEFWVTRKSDNEVLFDTRAQNIPTHANPVDIGGRDSPYSVVPGNALIFEDQYLQLSSALPVGANVFGLGEVVAESGYRRNTSGSVTTFWARDVADPIDENIYGTHPMYLEYRWDKAAKKSRSHGVFFLNSNGMDVVMRDGVIQYRAIGGTLDLYFFSGPTPNDVAAQYAHTVGLPQQMPYWAFGFQLCKWGYTSVAETKEVVLSMRAAGIPLEVQWNDIDWMRHYRQGQFDANFAPDDFKAFVDWLHANDQHYVFSIDAGIAILHNETDSYDVYSRGHELDVWTKNPDGTEYVGSVWPGLTVFPDWFHPKAPTVWTEFLRNLSSVVDFDGVWLDMNEPSSFITGSAMNSTVHLNWTERAPGYQYIPVDRPEDWPEGYNNYTSGLSGNITIDGKLTYGADGSRPVPSNTAMAKVDSLPAFRIQSDSPAVPQVSYEVEPRLEKRELAVQAPQIPNVDTPAYAIRNGGNDVLPLAYRTISPNATHHGGLQEYSVHNLWGIMEEFATNAALQAIHPGKRPFIIARSTFAGTGKRSGHWLGDNASTWAYMKRSIQGVLQFNLFGVPMVGPDTGGFGGNTDEELLNRWMMLSAFFPFYRNHNTKGAIPQEPFRWDSVRDASIKAIRARYAMLPYWETLFADVSAGGAPPVTPLFHQFDHPRYLANDYQFLLGPSVLVTPQLQPNATTVRAQVPTEGRAEWYDWWTHERVRPVTRGGKHEIDLEVPLGHIGVWVRSGSIVPLHESPEYTLKETRESGYALLIVLDAHGHAQGRLQIDDGVSLPVTERTEVTYVFHDHKITATVRGNHHVRVQLKSITVLGAKHKPSSAGLAGHGVEWQWDEEREKAVVTGLGVDMNQNWTIGW